jgi:acyl transferase domain-containing protein
LLSGDCDVALAGGVSISLPNKKGYIYQEGMILSKDGHCRAFDQNASGVVFGDGVAVVVLKRLEDAISENDNIYAIVRGTSVNNDGKRKIGYTAPSIVGQSEVIKNCHNIAEVDPGTISYVEAHGTGTNLGDPIEIQALKEAFNLNEKGACAIGSVKTNIGHLDAAAGATGFIKTVLSLKNRIIPPSLNFNTPNSKLNLESSPFYINIKTKKWEPDGYPLRAGVSSFGIGGTNAHVVLEEAPIIKSSDYSREYKMILLSAKSVSALNSNINNLCEYLKNNKGINFADVSYTLRDGEPDHRRAHRP